MTANFRKSMLFLIFTVVHNARCVTDLRRWTWTGDFKCREVKTGFCRKRWTKTGSSGTLIGWKSGQTTFIPLWDRMEGAWLWTLMSRYLFTIKHETWAVVKFCNCLVTVCESCVTSVSSHAFLFWRGCSYLCYSKCPLESLLTSVVVGDTQRSPGRPLSGACFLAGSNTWPEVALVASLPPVRRKPYRKD
jgi:hypothetical protein